MKKRPIYTQPKNVKRLKLLNLVQILVKAKKLFDQHQRRTAINEFSSLLTYDENVLEQQLPFFKTFFAKDCSLEDRINHIYYHTFKFILSLKHYYDASLNMTPEVFDSSGTFYWKDFNITYQKASQEYLDLEVVKKNLVYSKHAKNNLAQRVITQTQAILDKTKKNFANDEMTDLLYAIPSPNYQKFQQVLQKETLKKILFEYHTNSTKKLITLCLFSIKKNRDFLNDRIINMPKTIQDMINEDEDFSANTYS